MRRMCKVLQIHPSGYYAWKAKPVSRALVQTSGCEVCSSRPGWRAAACTAIAS